jgi:hypothetical protein
MTAEAMKEWNDQKLEWYATHQPDVSTWPWSILKEYQTKHNILTTGARELQNWRVERFLRGEPTVLSPVKRGVYYSDELPVFTVFPHTSTYEQPPDASGLLRILERLRDDPRAIFCLMLTCKDLQSVCHRLLVALAQQRFGPLGTPKALMCAVLYEANMPEELKRKAAKRRKVKRTLFEEGAAAAADAEVPLHPPQGGEEEGDPRTFFKRDLKSALHLSARDFKASNTHVNNVQTIIEIAIAKYGCVDNLPRVREQQRMQSEARTIEKRYVSNHVAERLAQVNAYFSLMGYRGVSVCLVDEKKCAFEDARVLLITSTFCNGNDYQTHHLLGCIQAWVFMEVERTIDHVCTPLSGIVLPLLFNTAMEQTSNAEPYHPLQPLVVQMLMDVRHRNYMFYDQFMSEKDWLARIGYVFSDHFRQQHKPSEMRAGNGSYVCCWRRDRIEMRIYHVNAQINASSHHYFVWMKMLAERYHLRLATPATGIAYTGVVPSYYVAGPRQVNFAHCLLAKK